MNSWCWWPSLLQRCSIHSLGSMFMCRFYPARCCTFLMPRFHISWAFTLTSPSTLITYVPTRLRAPLRGNGEKKKKNNKEEEYSWGATSVKQGNHMWIVGSAANGVRREQSVLIFYSHPLQGGCVINITSAHISMPEETPLFPCSEKLAVRLHQLVQVCPKMVCHLDTNPLNASAISHCQDASSSSSGVANARDAKGTD